MHIQMPGSDDCFSRAGRNVLYPYPSDTRAPYFYEHLTDMRLRKPCKGDCWQRALESIEWVISEMVLLAREQVISYDQQIKAAGKRYKRIMVLQPDVLFDEDGKAYMVECNTNGYMIGDLHKDFFSLQLEGKHAALHDPRSSDAAVEDAVDSIVTGLFSVLVTLGVVPVLRYSRQGAAQMVAEQLGKRLHDQLRAHAGLFAGDPASGSLQRPLLIVLERAS